MTKNSLSENLIYQRKLKGLTQEELSYKTSVTVRTIQRIEKGNVQPHMQTVKLLAAGLDVEIDSLLVLDNPNQEVIQRKWMLLFHGLPFLGLIIPFASILLPLFLWIHKAEDNKIYDAHGRAVVNFHGSILLYIFCSLLLFFAFPGYNFFVKGAIVIFSIVITFYNISRALQTGSYNYPLSISFLKPLPI